MRDSPSVTDDATCTGRGCPRSGECARVSKEKSAKRLLVSPWDEHKKKCVMFKRRDT